MWRYLLDLFLVLCGYGIWFLDEAVDLFFSSSLARRWAVFVLVGIAQDFCSLVQL
ncbi:hypothetical protein F2Q69_00054028 [Brassica cretica]|uniref:Uncharacterized protein n=1 Tax=Brassica cretica TaxID=69181 RepID=A0A8S9MW90_BRACR|nr:hypothetical protein F2Q69_00054028 [Brassica cretica]